MKKAVFVECIFMITLLTLIVRIHAQDTPIVSIAGQILRPYPHTYTDRPEIASPHQTKQGRDIVVIRMKDGTYALVPVTVESGLPLDYAQRQRGKGQQLKIDEADFPTLATTGLHSEDELDRTETITGKSVLEITKIGRPGMASGAGFMSDDEDIISVLKGDNRLVGKLGLTHPQLAKTLFHVWNLLLYFESTIGHRRWPFQDIEYVLYNRRRIFVRAEGTKGWQQSIFNDEIVGMFQIEIWTELNQREESVLSDLYGHLNQIHRQDLIEKLTSIYTGEMVFYYIMRYGFYEGHTAYRADPVALAFIFGLKSLEEIDNAMEGELYQVLTLHHGDGETESDL